MPSGWVVKYPPANAGDEGSFLDLERFPGEGNGNPLQYPCLENPMDRGAGWAAVHRVAKSRTQLKHSKNHDSCKYCMLECFSGPGII